MSIKFGSNTISNLKLGSLQIDKVYLGSNELWSNYALPVKGDVITIENNQYIVLEINGTNAKIFGRFIAAEEYSFSGSNSSEYSGSSLDNYLNTTWFGNQSATFQAAVNDSSITTYRYKYYETPTTPDTPTYTYQFEYVTSGEGVTLYRNANRESSEGTITRKVFALDLKDIYDYFGKVCITKAELLSLISGASSYYFWFRSAAVVSSSTSYAHAWYLDSSNPFITTVGGKNPVRPALNIDLSKISWSKVE